MLLEPLDRQEQQARQAQVEQQELQARREVQPVQVAQQEPPAHRDCQERLVQPARRDFQEL